MNQMGRFVLALWLISAVAVPNVMGVPEFKKAFLEKYAGDEASDDYKKMVRKAGCNVCHVPKQKKDVHNPYGEELKELIDGHAQERLKKAKEENRKAEELATLLEELQAAFGQVEQMQNSDGETYGNRIAQGKLPVDLPPKE